MRLRTAWQALGAALIATIFYLSLTPSPVQIPVEEGDKLGHVVAYATLMLWFGQIHASAPRRLACAAAFVTMGIAIEFLQRATGYRTFEVADMAADAAGVAAGWALAPPRTPNFLRWFELQWARMRA